MARKWVRQTASEMREADGRVLGAACAAALAGGLYAATGSGPLLAVSVISACLCALLLRESGALEAGGAPEPQQQRPRAEKERQ